MRKTPAKDAAPKEGAASEPPLSELLVDARGLGKRYGDFWAVRHVDLALPRGECLGIVGMNGAGKSTLLKIIAGTLAPTEGTIKTQGRIVPLLDLSAGFNDDFTGLENLYLSAAILGVPKSEIDRSLLEIEAFAEIGDYFRKPMRTYSSGMRVRLAFALLTQVRPDLMIIDEVLSVGDAYFAHKCARLLRKFREEGRSLLFVSHDPSAVKTYCDSAILLDKGLMVRSGLPIDVLDYYNAMIAAKEREAEIRISESSRGDRITRSGSGSAVLNRFDLLDENGKSVRAVLCGASVRIVCAVEFTEPVKSPTIGFMIRDRLGLEVFGTNTYYLGIATRTYGPGEVMEVAFSLPLTLGPGNYSCTLAVHAGADHREGNYDWRDNLLAFSIVPHWPFQFAGVTALPATATVSDEIKLLTRECEWNQPIEFNDQGSCHRYLASGWSVPEQTHCWTSGKVAALTVRLPSAGPAGIKAEVTPFLGLETKMQRVQFGSGDAVIAEWEVREPSVLETRIPASFVTDRGDLRLWWRLPDAASPLALGISKDARELGLAFRRVSFFPLDRKGRS